MGSSILTCPKLSPGLSPKLCLLISIDWQHGSSGCSSPKHWSLFDLLLSYPTGNVNCTFKMYLQNASPTSCLLQCSTSGGTTHGLVDVNSAPGSIALYGLQVICAGSGITCVEATITSNLPATVTLLLPTYCLFSR